MADKIYIKTGVSWVDVTTYVVDFTYEKPGKSAVDKLTVQFSNDINDTTEAPTFEKEIRFESDSTVVFGGRIERPTSVNPLIEVVAYSYGAEFLDILVSDIFESIAPEDLVQQVVEANSDLTFASTTASGITISKIAFQDATVKEIIQEMANLLGWDFFTDYLKQAFFEPPQSVDSGVTFTLGDNLLNKPTWDYNGDNVVNKITVVGETQNFDNVNDPDTFTATASQTDFTLTYIPSGSLEVTVNGTVKDPTVDGSSSGDYTFVPENKKVIFTTPMSGGESVSIKYSYSIPIRVTRQISTTNKTRERKKTIKAIKTKEDARRYALQYLSKYGQPLKSTMIMGVGYRTSIIPSYLVTVVDSLESTPINEQFVVNSLSYNYSSNITEYNIGQDTPLLWDWQTEVMERLRKLESQNENTNIVQISPYKKTTLSVNLKRRSFASTRNVNDSWIWGTSVWGTDKWGDRRDGDDFKSYSGTYYSLTDYWTIVGTGTVTDNQFVLSPSTTATYIDRTSTTTYMSDDLKLVTNVDVPSSGETQIYARYTDTNNYLRIDCGSSYVNLYEMNAGSGTYISQSGTISMGATTALSLRLKDTLFRLWNDQVFLTGTVNLDQTGNVMVGANTTTAYINDIDILTGG